MSTNAAKNNRIERRHAERTVQKSAQLAAEIDSLIPGGVNSPFRSFHEVGGHTIFFGKALGSKLYDVDGNSYIDYLGAWGPAILGHCPPSVVAATQKAIANGPVFGAPHSLELELARAVCKALPSIEKVRFVNSGTEAVMSAVRLARGFTGRDLLIMFEGCYHGHSDCVLASRSHSSSGGIPKGSAVNTLVVPFNDIEALATALKTNSGQVAAVLIEPVAGSMGVIAPEPGYLQAVADLCKEHGTLFIFDEVLTGLRVAQGGAQRLYDIKPDLTCLGKALGGGMPIGAYGGRAEIMNALLPIGDVYQAGTFSGNAATMAAAVETLRLLEDPQVYARLEGLAAQLQDGVERAATKARVALRIQRVGSMFAFLFSAKPIKNYADHLSIDSKMFSVFFHYLLRQGVYLPPSAVDAACLSAAHTDEDVAQTISIVSDALEQLTQAAE